MGDKEVGSLEVDAIEEAVNDAGEAVGLGRDILLAMSAEGDRLPSRCEGNSKTSKWIKVSSKGCSGGKYESTFRKTSVVGTADCS